MLEDLSPEPKINSKLFIEGAEGGLGGAGENGGLMGTTAALQNSGKQSPFAPFFSELRKAAAR